jgi:hypothetical protein
MLTLGYKLSSEEQSPLDLVRCAQIEQNSGLLRAPRGKRRGEARRRRKKS